jgi:hypothetical protein
VGVKVTKTPPAGSFLVGMPAALSFCLRRFFILVWPPARYLFWMDKDFCEERVACGAFFLPAALFYFSVASGGISFLDG